MDAAASARAAGLVYVNDDEPGIARRRCGRGFVYLDPHGGRITDAATIRRLRALAIPPAYTEVWICTDPNGHIQATGRDARGRKQYRYHPEWTGVRDAAKYASLVTFAQKLPTIRRHIQRDLARPGLCRERVLATVVELLEKTLIRVGNTVYARDNKSFGLTTLHGRHVGVNGAELRFRFKGKSGRSWNLRLSDRRVAKVIRSLQELPGQRLFRYLNDDGHVQTIDSDDVNAYIHRIAGAEFSSKHFRTWAGTVCAASLLRETALPPSRKAAAQCLNAVIDEVAARLGNTRAVCRRCYIHPAVIEAWLKGRLADALRQAAKGKRRHPRMSVAERDVLAWLKLSDAV